MTDQHPGPKPAHTRPRWVTLSALAGATLLVALLMIHLADGGMSHLHGH